MNNDKRLEIELRIVKRYIKDAEKAGWKVFALDNGDGYGEPYSGPADLRASDYDLIKLRNEAGESAVLYFVYGNEPGEVLNDCSVKLEPILAEANAYAEKYA